MKLLVSIIATLGYGLWAYYANCYSSTVANPEMIAMRAGIIQGSYAGALTLINVFVLETFYKKILASNLIAKPIFLTVTLATSLQYAIIVPIHIINGTPNIIITLLPGFFIGTLFSTFYTITFARMDMQQIMPGTATAAKNADKNMPR